MMLTRRAFFLRMLRKNDNVQLKPSPSLFLSENEICTEMTKDECQITENYISYVCNCSSQQG